MICWLCVSDTIVSVCMSRGVCVCVYFLLLSFKLSLGCLFSPHYVNQGHKVTLYEPHTAAVKSLCGDAEAAGTVRYCLTMLAKRGNSCTCCFCDSFHKACLRFCSYAL